MHIPCSFYRQVREFIDSIVLITMKDCDQVRRRHPFAWTRAHVSSVLIACCLLVSSSVAQESFTSTLNGAIKRLDLHRQEGRIVVHVAGAMDANEGSVDWARSVCQHHLPAVTIVLVGPFLTPGHAWESGHCKVIHLGVMYTEKALREAILDRNNLMSESDALQPDMVVLFNADAMMCPWRRTLAMFMTHRHRPHIVLTTYVKDEAESVEHGVQLGVFDKKNIFWVKDCFTHDAILECDSLSYTIYPSFPKVTDTPPANVPAAVINWKTEMNLYGHDGHGRLIDQDGRNAFWMSFRAAESLSKEPNEL